MSITGRAGTGSIKLNLTLYILIFAGFHSRTAGRSWVCPSENSGNCYFHTINHCQQRFHYRGLKILCINLWWNRALSLRDIVEKLVSSITESFFETFWILPDLVFLWWFLKSESRGKCHRQFKLQKLSGFIKGSCHLRNFIYPTQVYVYNKRICV